MLTYIPTLHPVSDRFVILIMFYFFRGADLAALVREASVSALKEAILNKGTQSSQVISVRKQHFETAFRKIRPSVSQKVKF